MMLFRSMVMPSWISGLKASWELQINSHNSNGGLSPQPSSQRSFISRGSESSRISESEHQTNHGVHKSPEIKSSSPENHQKLSIYSRTKLLELNGIVKENQLNLNRTTSSGGAKEIIRNVLEDMPCLSTTGDGPNGKRIKGFLYRYKKG